MRRAIPLDPAAPIRRRNRGAQPPSTRRSGPCGVSWREENYFDLRTFRMTALRLAARPIPFFALRTFAAPPFPNLLPA
jgi:hypothetical protein